MLYFAYGSNMSIQRMKLRVASAEFVSPAALSGHRLRFHKVGTDRSGKCDAFLTESSDDIVLGVVYRLDPADKVDLDLIEGVGSGYAEKNIELLRPEGVPMKAFTYCALKIDSTLRPYRWYKEHVLRGAEAAALPREYVDAIRAVESWDDPDAERTRRELSIYA